MSDALSKGGKGDREPNGRFVPGHSSPGPGNPNLIHLAGLRAAVREALTREDLAEILRALATAAKGGDVAAASVALSYSIGRPRTMSESSPAVFGSHIDLRTAAGLVEAGADVGAAFARGDMENETVKGWDEWLENQRKRIETSDLETRLRQLELAAGRKN